MYSTNQENKVLKRGVYYEDQNNNQAELTEDKANTKKQGMDFSAFIGTNAPNLTMNSVGSDESGCTETEKESSQTRIDEKSNVQETANTGAMPVQGKSHIYETVIMDGRKILERVDGVITEVYNIDRKRRSLITEAIITEPCGTISVVKTFDNGDKTAELFIINHYGPWVVKRLCVKEDAGNDFFAVSLDNERFNIVERIEKLTASKLYDLFIDNGVQFSGKFKDAEIGKLLRRSIAPIVKQKKAVVTISKFHGWHDSKVYRHKGNFKWPEEETFKDFPVCRKIFNSHELDNTVIDLYKEIVNGIKERNNRIFFVLYGFSSIITSLLDVCDKPLGFILNLIVLSPTSSECLAVYFQTMNRMRLLPIEGNTKLSEIVAEVSACRDETCIIDFRLPVEVSAYSRSRCNENKEQILKGFCNRHINKRTLEPMGMIFISDNLVLDENVINLFWNGKEPDRVTIAENQAITALFYGFMEYVKNNYDYVIRVIKEYVPVSKNRNAAVLETIYHIVESYFEGIGLKLEDLIATEVSDGFDELFESNCIEDDQLQSFFIKAVRKSAYKYKFIEDDQLFYLDTAIYFCDEYLWIPTTVLEEIMISNGLYEHRYHLLYRLKERRMLITDERGLSRRHQKDGFRSEYYQFRKDFFNIIGHPDIVDLGGEMIC